MKKQKGFTLVECIVALAVLGIAAMVMAQVYSMVCKANEMNHRMNESLSNTVAKAEGKDTTTTTEFIKIDKTASPANVKITFTKKGTTTAYNMDTTIYVYYSKDSTAHGNAVYADPSKDPIGLRYKYFD